MSIFDRKKRKQKRGIVPVPPEKTYPAASYWDSYENGEYEEVTAPEPSYDRFPTTYDSPAPSSPSQSYDTGSSGNSGGSHTSDTSSPPSGDSGGGSW